MNKVHVNTENECHENADASIVPPPWVENPLVVEAVEDAVHQTVEEGLKNDISDKEQQAIDLDDVGCYAGEGNSLIDGARDSLERDTTPENSSEVSSDLLEDTDLPQDTIGAFLNGRTVVQNGRSSIPDCSQGMASPAVLSSPQDAMHELHQAIPLAGTSSNSGEGEDVQVHNTSACIGTAAEQDFSPSAHSLHVTQKGTSLDLSTSAKASASLEATAEIPQAGSSTPKPTKSSILDDAADFGELRRNFERDYVDPAAHDPSMQDPAESSCMFITVVDSKLQSGKELQQEPVQISGSPTRSSARLSDTSILRDFVSRTQASKAARDSKKKAASIASPRRSPRKALAVVHVNSPSPKKQNELANRPGTPPGKQKLGTLELDDIDETNAEPTSCRRSTRTRFPAPAKEPLGAPSFIPVRRADGTDPVVLQKSVAQELAIITRANTRRNKGQSKPPGIALQNLSSSDITNAEIAIKQAHESSKNVAWAERLIDYHESSDASQRLEQTTRVRRLRGLGAVNGTPAPKRIKADMGSSNGTPAPKRRAKAK